MSAARFVVSGRVQGVCFRAGTRAQAQRLGLRGLARNRHDGTVEVVAEGDAAALDQLHRWLQHGPPAAHVADVVRTEAESGMPDGFSIA